MIQHTKEKIQKPLFSIFVIYVSLTCAIYILPAANFLLPYIFVASLMLLSLPILLHKDSYLVKYTLLMILVTFYLFCSNFFVNGLATVDVINDAIRNLRFFLPVLWGVYAIRFCDGKQQKAILIILLLIIVYVTINTMIALEEEPWIARILASDKTTTSAEINAYRIGNVGGYSFSYMMGVVTLIFAYFSFMFKKTSTKVLCVAITVLCFYYIIQTMYTTLLLLCSIGVILIIFLHIKSPQLRVLVLVVSVGLVFLLPKLFEYLSGVFSSESILSTKFDQMTMAMSGEGIDSLGRRPQLISNAIKNWLEHPFFGSYSENPSHSLVMEYLQQNGIFGFAAWMTVYIASWKILYRTLKENGIKTQLFNICMCYFSALSFFNDTKYTFEITIATFFIVPIVSAFFCKKQDG